MNKLVVILVIVFGSINLGVYAEKMTLEQCVNFALEHNLALEMQRYALEKQEVDVKSAFASFLPNANAYANYREQYGRSIDPQTNAVSNNSFFASGYGINSSLSLFEGFLRNNRIKYEKALLSTAKAQVEKAEVSLTFRVIEHYTEAVFYLGAVQVIQEQVSLSEQFLIRQERLLALGQVAPVDLIDIEAQLANDSLSLIRYQMYYQLAKNGLKKVMNLPLEDKLDLVSISSDNEVLTSVSTSNLMSLAESHLPEIKILKENLKATTAQLGQAKSWLFPRLELNANMSSAYYETTKDISGDIMAFEDQYDGNMSKRVALNLYIPLFNRWYRMFEIKKAKLSIEQAQMYYDEVHRQVEYQIGENILLLDAAVQNYLAVAKSEEKQKLAYESGEKRLEKGLIDILDFYTLKNNFAQARSEKLRSDLELFIRYKTIKYYMTGKIL